MGFMDKAKKLADQAQAKLDEVQRQFNEGQSSASGQGAEDGPHGRPMPRDEEKPQGDPVAGSNPPAPAEKTPHVLEEPGDQEKRQGDPLGEDAAPKPPAPPSGSGGLTSGDPLAG